MCIRDSYRDGADFNPYVFDGSMSIEDFELMHRMIEKERSEQMAEPILSGYLSNLGKYTEGRPAGEWEMCIRDRQYTLTLTEETEIRYRTETSTDPETGETTTEEVPYEYHILNVKLTNKPISEIAEELLDVYKRQPMHRSMKPGS